MAEVLRREQGALPKGGKEVIDRATFLPIGQYEDGSLTFAWPGFLKDAWEGAQRTFLDAGNVPVPDAAPGTRWSSDVDALNAASIAPMAGVAGRVAGAIPRGVLGSGGSDMVTKPKGITAYHGSPHDFDKFDLSKIGTGEGAQAYGHGLYFAEAEPVAKKYRDRLSSGDAVNQFARKLANDYTQEYGSGAVDALKADLARLPSDTYSAPHIREAINLIENGQSLAGRMYEVRINAEPEQFLDWDKPLGQQSPHIRDSLAPFGLSDDAKSFNILQGIAEDLRVKNRIAPDRDLGVQVSDVLRDSGLPGIRYLDQGSRAAGEGSRNYVVFDDDLVEILRKYANPETAALPYLMQSGEDKPSMSSILRRQ
jgi:hypothetical protein